MIRSHVLLCVTLSLAVSTSLGATEYHLAFWNVENLFDTVDDPAVEKDEDFTPTGEMKWTDERLQQKLTNLTRVISAMNDKHGPDILGLAEIENRAVLDLLVAKLKPLGRHYKIVHRDSPSGRGIDCALLYDADKFDLQQSQFHAIATMFPTRDIVEAELKSKNGDKLTVFVNHWPSRRNPESERLLAAEALRKRLDAIFTQLPAADVALIGDFNDYVDNLSLAKTLQATDKPDEAKHGVLYNTMGPMFKAGTKGSYVYQDKWEIIDHIIISPGLLDKTGFQWKVDSTSNAIVVDNQLYHPKLPAIPRPSRSYSGPIYHKTGYSDHLPVQAIITR